MSAGMETQVELSEMEVIDDEVKVEDSNAMNDIVVEETKDEVVIDLFMDTHDRNEVFDRTIMDNFCGVYKSSLYSRRDYDLEYNENYFVDMLGETLFNEIRNSYVKNMYGYCVEHEIPIASSEYVTTERKSVFDLSINREYVENLLLNGITPGKTIKGICVYIECDVIKPHNVLREFFLNAVLALTNINVKLYLKLDYRIFHENKSYVLLSCKKEFTYLFFNLYYPFKLLKYMMDTFPNTYKDNFNIYFDIDYY